MLYENSFCEGARSDDLRAGHVVCYWTTVGIGRKSPVDGANRRRFDLCQRLQRKQLRHQSQMPRAQAKHRKLARTLNIRHLVWEASRLSAQLAVC
jgi:hypothetical protein